MIKTDIHLVNPGAKVNLGKISGQWKHLPSKSPKEKAAELLLHIQKKTIELQELLYAEHKHKVMIVLQGMDTAGKDGVIKHVFEGMNPQGVKVSSFKVPTKFEADHDFLLAHSPAHPRQWTDYDFQPQPL